MSAPRTFTHPDVFTLGVEQGWAEAETDPSRIDWPARQAAAAIPFEVVNGRPVNPCEKTGIAHGRNEMGFWGEQQMADALVTVSVAGQRYLLMVERHDGYGWAVPGGHAEPGETRLQAAARELAEETGLALALDAGRPMAPRYVPDPRSSDEAWAVTVPVRFDLGGGPTDTLPEVTGGDDARRAAWVPAGSYAALVAALDRDHAGGRVFAAHAAMLADFLAGGAPVEIVSFGYGHGPAPAADITVDVRHHFRDPHVDPALRYLTATDERVARVVLSTPGVPALVRSIVLAVFAFLAGPGGSTVVMAVGCAGGRHRSPVIAADVAQMLEHVGIRVALSHRDMHRPVIERSGGAS